MARLPPTRFIRSLPPDHRAKLAHGQSIVTKDNGSSEIISNVNKQIKEADAGRLFSVVHIRGKQHKVTAGNLLG